MIILPFTDSQLTGGITPDPSATNGFYALLENVDSLVAQLNAGTAFTQLTLPTPSTNDPIYDTQPIAAIHIAAPLGAGTTRNFVSALWIETKGSATDKGRGILVSNLGASDGIYVQCDGPGGTGEAILLTVNATPSATGMVIGTTLAGHIALALRQETSILPTAASSTLLGLTANGSVTEMMQVGSTLAAQVGLVFRMFGAGSVPIVIKDNLGNSLLSFDNQGSAQASGNYTALKNTAIPAGGAVDTGYLFSNVPHLGVYFGSGAPSVSAAQGSLYLRTDGSSGTTRAYINTNGTTGWTAVNTVA